MIDGLFVLALLGGLWAARHGNRAAWALLGSTMLTSALILARVPFDFGLWLLIDVAVIVAIESGPVRKQERAVIALFAPAWVLYHLMPPWADKAITLIVAAQFFLVVPWDRLEQRIWKARAA